LQKKSYYKVLREPDEYDKQVSECEMAEIKRITVDEVKKRIDKGESILFIDTRNPHDWGESDVKLPGALRIHFSELEQHLDELPRNGLIVAYCT
jgi:rhodanese-related sulfurtransferase